MSNIESVISKYDKNYIKDNEKYYLKYDGIDICYNSKEKIFFVNKNFFTKIPHVMPNGMLCLYGNKVMQIQESNEEVFISNTLDIYIPWLFNSSPEVKALEFINEIDYFIRAIYGKKTKKFKKCENIYKTIQVLSPLDLWETIDSLKLNKVYEIYPNKYSEYKFYIKKKENEYIINYDSYNKSRLRILGDNIRDIEEKVCFIGVGSVNSYVIKQYLALNVKDIVLIDNDMFKIDNAFRFAFPYRNKSKVECVKEFIKILEKPVNVQSINIKITAESSGRYIEGCNTIYVSVDNFYAWLHVLLYLKNNASNDAKIIFVGIDAFGGYGKFINTGVENIVENVGKFLRYNDNGKRRLMVGNGCGRSLAVYDEEALNKLAKKVINNDCELGKVEKVDF